MIVATLRNGVVLNANDRHHWRETNRRKKAIAGAFLMACKGHSALPEPCHLVVTVVHPRRDRRRDAPNWAPTSKAAVDAVVRAGLLSDDNNQVIKATTFVAAHDPAIPGGHCRIELDFRAECE